MNITLLDGGMGQELLRRSHRKVTPLWSADIMLHEPNLVRDLHCEFIQSGARVITLNNYTATPYRMARDGALHEIHHIHKSAIQAAQDAIHMAGQSNVKIAGCLPPLVASYRSEVILPYEDSLKDYRHLVDLQAADCDLFLCETMSSIDEARAACVAAKESQKDVWVSFTVDDDNPSQLRSGEPLSEAATQIEAIGANAILLNCSHPEIITQSMAFLKDIKTPIGAYANAFQCIHGLKPGGTVSNLKARDDLSPQQYAPYAIKWHDMGATIIGGCCEIGPEHIKYLHQEFKKMKRII